MAIFHLHVGIVSRKTGRSSVAAAAYRAGEKLHNERDGITHDYTRKTGVVYSEIMLPENAPQEYINRSILWNAAEKAEKRCDAQTARDFDIALPVEFSRQEQIDILQKYIKENFVSHGMCADFVIHDKEDGNPHAHILLTTRNVTKKGFGDKNRDWNKPDFLEQWRENWANICNERFEQKGLSERIDHRTLEAQGIDREPTIHKGRNPDRIIENQGIIRRNIERTPEKTAEYMHELKQGYIILEKEVNALKQEVEKINSKMQSLRIKTEEITERAEQIHTMKQRIDELKAVRQDTKRLEHSYEQAVNFFKRNYYISPDETAAELKRIEYKVKDMERIQERLQDRLTPFVADKNIIMLEYQRQKLLAEINLDNQRIQDRLVRLDKEAYLQEQTTQGKIARTRSERNIDEMTDENFNEILKEVKPEQAKILIKNRERERERERTRKFERERF